MEKEMPVWEKFWAWIETLNPLGGSKLEKAVNYAINHKETLCNYLQDGRCELSNNAAKRRAKAYAIGVEGPFQQSFFSDNAKKKIKPINQKNEDILQDGGKNKR